MLKNVIFDFDGTLADTLDTIVNIINRDPKTYGVDQITPEEVQKLRNLSVKTLISEFKINIFRLPKLIKTAQKAMSKEMGSVKMFDGMHEVLTELVDNGYVLGIVTSNSEKNVRLFLEANGLTMFKFVCSERSLFGKHKVLKKLMKKHHFATAETLYVGDEVRDIEASKEAGIRVAAVTWGFNSKDALERFAPDYLVDSPAELVTLISMAD